jgi:hypothetical protein
LRAKGYSNVSGLLIDNHTHQYSNVQRPKAANAAQP